MKITLPCDIKTPKFCVYNQFQYYYYLFFFFLGGCLFLLEWKCNLSSLAHYIQINSLRHQCSAAINDMRGFPLYAHHM